MKCKGSNIFLQVGAVILFSLAYWQPCNAEKAIILTIRQDKLPNIASSKIQTQKASQRRDPFNWPAKILADYAPRKTFDPSQLFTGLVLESIMHDGDNSIVTINGKILSRGDVVNGAKVIGIEKDSVTLGKGDISHTINLGKKLYSFKTSKTIEKF